jgi:hypothetical protein
MAGMWDYQTDYFPGQVFLLEFYCSQEGIHLMSKRMRVTSVPGPRDG